MTPRQLGQRLKRLREARGLSQYAMAAKVGMSRQYLRKLEAGLSDPTFGMLQRLAQALKVKLVDLVQVRRPRRRAPKRGTGSLA